ncbi:MULTISPECIES: macrolide family glycosyltransferase [unclassified Streptomyces]|uniref:macrolide family glycosyltransferase n=1 Tax=unclassified Streptomyces TaxID=2593676 RepID=UPI0035E17DB5
MASHIAFFNFPAFGHLNPTLGVVEELVRRGHRVSCTTTDHFAPAIEAVGAEPVRYTSVFGQYYTNPFTPEAISGEGLRTLEEATSLVSQVEGFYGENQPDVILHDFMAWGARFYAAQQNIPTVRLFPSYGVNEHFSIQAKFPMAEMTDPKVMEMVTKLDGMLPGLGFPGMTSMEFFMEPPKRGIIFLPRDFHYDGHTFDERFVFAGPCLGDRSAFQGTWQPPSQDRPVLLISLGTAATGWPEFFRICVEALANSRWDVVMAVGDNMDPAELGDLPANFDVRRSVPQLDVLRHAELFITHGGMNSVMESLYNGVPMIVNPLMSEQRANGLRVEELGFGRLLTREDFSLEALHKAIDEVSADKSVADRTRAMGEAMRKVDGPAVAADAVESYLAEGTR